jgi:hypothetical protein
MLFLVVLPITLQLVLPLCLLATLAFLRARSRLGWWTRAMLTGAYLAAIGTAGLWLALPWYLPVVYAALYLVAIAWSWRRTRAAPVRPGSAWGWAGAIVCAAAFVAFAGLGLHALRGRTPPRAPSIDLEFPLREGHYLVAHGGSVELINNHLMTLTEPRFAAYRGQSHAIDIVALNSWGTHGAGMLPRDPAAYAIFGDTVYAPCGGTVVRAIDGIADMAPPRMDRANMAGNHVMLDCGGAWILLGHLQRGSVEVATGDPVAPGRPLGRVGNSGNTSEPHLHIHAQTPGTAAAPLGGDPIPVSFGGRALYRNARITPPE